MERKYYTIDEKAARQAQGMWSFSDYVTGSKTAEYKQLVDKAYDLADQVAEEKPDRAEEVYSLADRYARKLADNFNADSRINLMCPSVMIAGPANFPVKKKEKQNRAAERNHQEYQNIQKYLEKIRKILYGSDIIKSDDKDAVEKLQEKLDSLQKRQEQMKAVNAYYRKHKTLDGCPDLSPEDIERLKQAMKADWHYQDKPYLSFELSNNNQNIHATKARLERLKAAKEKETTDYDTEHFKVVENTEMMRLQLFFDGKPDVEIREIVKRNGFKWSPKNECWQRQLTGNAKYSLKCLIKQLDQLAG
ncbi:MAG: hypothetical protein HDT30_08920 [Clostridiales bacterium]|nr:hypothetical protein [Clostridiales bacterium]